MSGEVWTQVYDRLAELVGEHRTTLVFVNTRRHAERVARHLSERLGEDTVTAHHGSMAKELRLDAESASSAASSRRWSPPPRWSSASTSATSIWCASSARRAPSPRSCSAWDAPATPSAARPRDGCFRCRATISSSAPRCWTAVRRGELDRLRHAAKPLDVLAQQIVAEVAAREWDEDGLFALMRGAYPYRDLTREEFDELVRMLAEGFSTRRGRHGALIHHDAVNQLHPRPPRRAPHRHHLRRHDPRQRRLPGDPRAAGALRRHGERGFRGREPAGRFFQLGNALPDPARRAAARCAWRMRTGKPPSIPFWLGEAPGRTDELSLARVALAPARSRPASTPGAEAARAPG